LETAKETRLLLEERIDEELGAVTVPPLPAEVRVNPIRTLADWG
jgi:hypothetical protein